MRAAVSLMLATALVTTPLKLVLAQAAEQEAATVQQTRAQDSSGHRLIGVPRATDNTSRLWRNPSDRALLNTDLADALLVQEDDPGTAWWNGLSLAEQVFVFLGFIVVSGAIVGGVLAAGEGDNPNSFKSTHDTFEGVGLGALLAIPVTVFFGLLYLVCGEGPCN